jgi:hypothetical protein
MNAVRNIQILKSMIMNKAWINKEFKVKTILIIKVMKHT